MTTPTLSPSSAAVPATTEPPAATVLGYRIHLGTMAALAQTCLARQTAGQSSWVVTLNPEMIMRGQASPDFDRCLHATDVCLPDGAGVVWALQRQGIIQPRLPGIEFAEALMAALANQGGRVALIGAHPEVVARAATRLSDRYPGLTIAMEQDGYFDTAQEPVVVDQAIGARPQLVLVALGVPRQELLIERYRAQFEPGTILVGVGGSFDVWSGTIARAPGVFRALSMEWVWRLASQPWRIRRSLGPLARFAVQVVLDKPQPPGSVRCN